MLIAQLQQYLRESARQRSDAVAVPPFTLFLNPTNSDPYGNYAIPDEPVGGDLAAPLLELRTTARNHGRRPRFEFIEEYAPQLAASLRAAGFVEETRTALMICAARDYRPAPVVAGLEVYALADDAPLDDVRAVMEVQRRGFGNDQPVTISDTEAQDFREWLTGTFFVLARLDGIAVGAGSLTAPIGGIAEVAGIATLAAYRRRGIAAAATDCALRAGFAHGVTLAMLTAADERAGRVYQRVGFQPIGTALAFIEPEDGA